MNNSQRGTLQAGDTVRVELVLTNSGTQRFKNPIYLDSNDRKLFTTDQTNVFTLTKNGGKEEQYPMNSLVDTEFDYGFDLADMDPQDTITIRYIVTANPIAFGKINVGLLEK